MNYTVQKSQYDSEDIVVNNYSFAPSDHREICFNKWGLSFVELKTFVKKEFAGEQIDVSLYIKQKTPYKLITIKNMEGLILEEQHGGEFIYKNIYENSSKKLQKGAFLVSRNASLAKISYIYNDLNGILNGGISSIFIENEVERFYVMSFFISSYAKNLLELITSSGGTQQNIKRETLLSLEIPTVKEENVKKILSFITHNIIDKEQQIKEKNQQIDSLIKKELEIHSHTELNTPFSSEIQNNSYRFDSGLYSPEYKGIKESIEFYEGGYFNLLSKYNAKRGQNLQVSNIGLSIYSEERKNNFYRLVTNVELTEDRTISTFRYLGNKNKLTLIPKNSIMLSADGSVGRCIYIDDLGNTITNIHPWILISKEKNTPAYKNIYVAMFLGYLRSVGYYEKIQDKSNGGGIKLPHLENWIKIPEFPDELQKEIASKYYNKVESNKELTLDTYLEKEKERNNLLGIWQLNMELFTLKEQVEELVRKIVYSEEINISDYL